MAIFMRPALTQIMMINAFHCDGGGDGVDLCRKTLQYGLHKHMKDRADHDVRHLRS